MFEDFELDPLAIGIGLFGGVISMVVMSKTSPGLITRVLSFVFTSIVCYFVFSFIKNK